MPVMIRKRSKGKWIFLILILIIVGFLLYYHLLYKPPRVDNGVASLALVFDKHRNIVTSVRFSPDDSRIVTSSVDSTIKTWERSSGKLVNQIKQAAGVAYMDLSNDGRYVVTGGL